VSLFYFILELHDSKLVFGIYTCSREQYTYIRHNMSFGKVAYTMLESKYALIFF